MKPLYDFLVYLPKKFKDTITVGGTELYLANKYDEFGNRYCSAEIVSVPQKYDTGAKPGDTLYFHHHVVLESKYKMGNDIYRVLYDPNGGYNSHAYAYQNKIGIHMLDEWVFLEAYDTDEQVSASGLLISTDKAAPTTGVLLYDSVATAELGIKAGDEVGFSKESDYAMEVDGKKVWRMRISDLMYVKKA